MQIDVDKVFVADEFLKLPALHTLVKEVMQHPELNKIEICKKIDKIPGPPPKRFGQVIFIIRRLWHRTLLTFSKAYRQKFNHAVSIIQLSVKQNSSAIKAQKVFRGHLERRKFKQMKLDQKEEAIVKLQSALLGMLARKQIEAKRKKKMEEQALQQLIQWRRRNKVYNSFKTITLELAKKELQAAEKSKSDLTARMNAFIKYRDALATVDTTKAAYEKFFDTAGKKLTYWFNLLEDKQTADSRIAAKAAYDKALYELAEIRSKPPIEGFFNDLEGEIQQIQKEIDVSEAKLTRANKIKALAEAKYIVPLKPIHPPPASAAPPQPPIIQSPEPAAVAIVIPPPPAKPAGQDPYGLQSLKSPKGKMLNSIYATIHRDLKIIWEEFFKKCDPDDALIKEWTCDAQGNFLMKLSEPLKMWVPSVNEDGVEDPKGGVVMMLGEPDKLVAGKLDSEKKTMNFDQGFSIHCRYPIPLHGEMPITPKVFRLVYENKDRVLFGAGIELFGRKLFRDRVKTVENLVNNWGKNGVVVKGDHENYLWNRMHPTQSNGV